jgi:hypothetical protein
MAFADEIVNPLTAVRDRSQMRGDHKGTGACARAGRRVPAGTSACSEIVAARKTTADTSFRIDASCRQGHDTP